MHRDPLLRVENEVVEKLGGFEAGRRDPVTYLGADSRQNFNHVLPSEETTAQRRTRDWK
jgi:hypothetical protein